VGIKFVEVINTALVLAETDGFDRAKVSDGLGMPLVFSIGERLWMIFSI
jgi:hypothetical protein